MKKALIILGNYSPNPSSVSNCMNPLIKKLSETYIIDVITDRKRVDVPECEIKNNVSVYRVDDYRIMNTIYSNELNKINSSYPLRKITKLFTTILKTAYYIRYVMLAKEQGTAGWEKRRVLDKIVELDKKNKYDIIISASQPFQSHYIAEQFKYIKGDNLKWIVFQFDPFTFNDEIKVSRRRRKKMYIDEKRILSKCDAVLLTPELYEYYKKKNYIEITSKFSLLPFANLEPVEFNSTKVSKNYMLENKINCLFTGRLYGDIRNPKKVLDVFSKLDNEIHLVMMTNFSINEMKEWSPNEYLPSIIPFQNRDTALYNLLCADILVNIGNTVEHQVPGKVFEYMSTGKPIIHFSKIPNDPALKYLKRYPKIFVVNEWEMDEIDYKKKLDQFCKDNHKQKLTFENVNRALGEYSGEAVQGKFINIINEMLGEKQSNE